MKSTCLLAFALALTACSESIPPDLTSDAGPPSCVPSAADPTTFSAQPESCAYMCPPPDGGCPEQTTPYTCASLGAWACIPHASSCASWSGVYPTVQPGLCTATAPSGEAAKYAGPDPDHPGVRVLPDGRRISPAGSEWIFEDKPGGLTSAILAIPGTSFVLAVDTGMDDHAVRVIDPTKIPGGGSPVVSTVDFPAPATLNNGIAFRAPDLVLVATDDGVVQALKLVTSTGQLTQDDGRSVKLPPSADANGNPQNWYASGVATSPDGKRLVVTGVADKSLLVYDVGAGSSTYGQLLGSVNLGQAETFGVSFDPNDPTGHFAYVAMWRGQAVLEVDVSNPAAPAVTRSFATDKDPEGLAFLDARWIAVSNDLGESISLIDRMSGNVTSVPIELPDGHGLDSSAVAFDPASKRLYVALAGINAVAAYDVDTTKTPPGVTPHGRLPTAWWPGGVAVLADGSLVVASMRGHGSGPSPMHFDVGDGNIGDDMHGGVQYVPAPTDADLTAGDMAVASNLEVSALTGAPTVSCPPGVSDFPVPATNTEGPSKALDHVFLIVRENKDFDGLFGDFSGVNGDPTLTLKTDTAQMDGIWTNLRALARTFTISDNYYTDAVYSTQGHVWTTYGRTNDFNERTWIVSGDGRNARLIPGGGVEDVGQPVEGSLFDWLAKNQIVYDIEGEIVGSPQTASAHNPIDVHYPGGPFQNISHNDNEKACHIAGRLRVTCDLGNFVYATLPNDHTFGLSPSNPTPETLCAVNDDATGQVIDALSHSPLWASSIVFITEDDPSQGGEHVDAHRAPLVVISPWVKRGYVSSTHIDVASVHKIFAHVFGKPYPNLEVANAGLPLDMFTSAPDYTPYTYAPRTYPLACGTSTKAAERALTDSWDFSLPDEQPGLDAQVERWMRGKQLEVLPPALEAQIARRARARARGY